MTITVWEPPRRAVVRHTGRVVRGSGAFEVQPLGDHRSRIVWSEWVQLPFGIVGRLGWPLARLVVGSGVRFSLGRPPATSRAAGPPGDGRGARAGRPARCPWGAGSSPDYTTYHDDEWGRPVRGEPRCSSGSPLEAFQSGLPGSPSCASARASGSRSRGSTPRWSPRSTRRRARLMADAGIVRNRAKVAATIANARAVSAARAAPPRCSGRSPPRRTDRRRAPLADVPAPRPRRPPWRKN